jgi:hypothetical protein
MNVRSRRNQLTDLAEVDIVLTVGGTLLAAGFVYLVVAAVIDGTARGLSAVTSSTPANTTTPTSYTIGPGGSTASLA